MTVNVKGRDIVINDDLAGRLEAIGQGPLDELFVLSELAAFYKKDYRMVAQTMPEEELANFIQRCIRDYLDIAGEPYR